LGYFVGWSIIFDYIINPIICVVWISGVAHNIYASIPYAVYAIFFVLLFTVMNLRGIEASARTNAIIAMGLGVVIVLFLAAAVQYLWGHPPEGVAGWTQPFYDPKTFSFNAVSSGAALAVLTYIGFDGVSTLSEEAHNPRRNILLATVLVCVITGVLSAVQVYLAQLVWPGTDFPDQDAAFCYVAGKAGGHWLFMTVSAALLVANIGSGSGAHLAAGRLLYSMGRDNAIPRTFFAAINPRTQIPANNILLIGAIMLVGVFTLDYALGADLLNFGALIAFMGVNVAALLHYFVRGERKRFWDLASPVLGAVICAYLWWSLGRKAHVVGAIWLATGIAYGAWRTGGFRRRMEFAKLEEKG
jgi:amino acid transporter